MDKLLSASEYGICLFSFEVLQDFLKANKKRSKKLLHLFQKDKKLYLKSQEQGIWFPMAGINFFEYVIKVDGFDEPFGDEWEQKLEYSGFNLEIKNGLWISGFGSLFEFKPEQYGGEEGSYAVKTPFGDIMYYYNKNEVYRKSLEGKISYTDYRYDIPDGKYLLSVKGYTRGEKKNYTYGNCGFFFSLTKVDAFDGFKNPREDEEFDFNVGSIE